MSVISTYLNDNAQTPLNCFVVYMLYMYKQVCNKHGDKSNRWSLGPSHSVGGLKHRRCDKQSPSCAHLLIAAHRVAKRIVSKSTVVHTKMGHVSKTTPFLGVIYYTFDKT